MNRTTKHALAFATLAALTLSGCADPFSPSVATPDGQPSPSTLPNRVMLPAVGGGAPPSNRPAATIAPTAVQTPTTAPKQVEPDIAIRFCAHRTDFKPATPVCVDSAPSFAPGVSRVNGVWQISAWPGASLSGRWYLNGQMLSDAPGSRTRSLCWDGKPEALGFTRSGPQFVALNAASLGVAALAPGAYRFELYADGKLFLNGGFGVGLAGAFDPALILAAPSGGAPSQCPR